MRALALAACLAVAAPAPAIAQPLQEADISVLRAINQAHSPVADVFFDAMSNEWQTFLSPVAAGYVASGGQWGLPLRVVEAEAVSLGIFVGMKTAFARPRPYVTYPDLRTPRGPAPMDSFPSGHAATAFAGATAIALEQPAWAVPAYGWAALVGYSRMYTGVHYPSDVLAGAAVGVGSAYLAHWLFAGLNTRLGLPNPGAETPVMPLTWSGSF